MDELLQPLCKLRTGGQAVYVLARKEDQERIVGELQDRKGSGANRRRAPGSESHSRAGVLR